MSILSFIGGAMDSLPVVGHIKGAVQYIYGDEEGGVNAIKSATRTSGTVVFGTLGTCAFGPAGGMSGGVFGGFVVDSLFSNDEEKYGVLKQIHELQKDPTNSTKLAGTLISVGLDAATGCSAGSTFKQIIKQYEFKAQKNNLINLVGEGAANDLISCASANELARQTYNIKADTPHVTSFVRDLETGESFEGHNKQVRDSMSSIDILDSPTNLEKRLPDAEPPLNRPASSCAEQQAYDKYYEENPDGDPKKTRVSSVRHDTKSGEKRAVQRCSNCMAYKDVMGDAPGDSIHNETVPIYPESSKKKAVTAFLCPTCFRKLAIDNDFTMGNISEDSVSASTVSNSYQGQETFEIFHKISEELDMDENESSISMTYMYRRRETVCVGSQRLLV